MVVVAQDNFLLVGVKTVDGQTGLYETEDRKLCHTRLSDAFVDDTSLSFYRHQTTMMSILLFPDWKSGTDMGAFTLPIGRETQLGKVLLVYRQVGMETGSTCD
jgi:hypothetical protein